MKSGILLNLSRVILLILVPILLVIASVRLVMSPAFLWIEYNRPGFPEDPYGFTQDDRLRYAPPAIEYLVTNVDDGFLADLRLPRDKVPPTVCIPAPEDTDLCYMFNERERKHMVDVKIVTKHTYNLGLLSAALSMLNIVYLFRHGKGHLRSALFGGSVLTLVVIAGIVLAAATMWRTFFTLFHQLFFEGDTWLFNYYDTLIRLFPEQFWFDAAIAIGILTILGSVILMIYNRPIKGVQIATPEN